MIDLATYVMGIITALTPVAVMYLRLRILLANTKTTLASADAKHRAEYDAFVSNLQKSADAQFQEQAAQIKRLMQQSEQDDSTIRQLRRETTQAQQDAAHHAELRAEAETAVTLKDAIIQELRLTIDKQLDSINKAIAEIRKVSDQNGEYRGKIEALESWKKDINANYNSLTKELARVTDEKRRAEADLLLYRQREEENKIRERQLNERIEALEKRVKELSEQNHILESQLAELRHLSEQHMEVN